MNPLGPRAAELERMAAKLARMSIEQVAAVRAAGVRDETAFSGDVLRGAGDLERLAPGVHDAFRARVRQALIDARRPDTSDEHARVLAAAAHPALMAVFVRERPAGDDQSALAAAWRRLLAPWDVTPPR